MKTMFSKICSLASLMLALTLTLSCSNDDGDSSGSGNGGGSGNNSSLECNLEYECYDPYDDEQRCQNGVTEFKCYDGWYNPLYYYCTTYVAVCDPEGNCSSSYDGRPIKAKERCGSKYYEPDDYTRCQNGVIDCGISVKWYNEITQNCEWKTGTVRCGS